MRGWGLGTRENHRLCFTHYSLLATSHSPLLTPPDQYFDWQALHEQSPGGAGIGSRARLKWLLFAFVAIVLTIVARAAQLELTLGARFRDLAAAPVTKEIAVPAVRGRILARDGTLLACDRQITSLAVQYRYLEEPVNAAWLKSQVRLRLSPRQRRDHQLVADTEAAIVAERTALHKELRRICHLSATEWDARVAKIQSRVSELATNVNRRRLERYEQSLATEAEEPASWENWPSLLAALLSPEQPRPPAPVVVAEELEYHVVQSDLSAEAIATLRTAQASLPGMKLVEQTQRSYPHGALAAHTVGHVGRNDSDSAAAAKFAGRMGVELSREEDLRGANGSDVQRKNHRGEVLSVEHVQQSVAGADLRLAIDVAAQQCAESLLDRACRAAATDDRKLPAQGGAIVVLDIHTGETLVLASAPRFEPRWFAAGDSPQLSDTLADERQPLFDRAIKMALPPGSVFKTLTSIALLETGTLQGDEAFHCQGYWRDPEQMRCMIYRRFGVGHGDVTLRDALAQSCNVFFFHYATELGSPALCDWSRRFGLGQKTGIELPDEATGSVPTSDSAAIEKLARRTSQTQAFAIGQSTLSTTPLQIARLMAAVANGGRLVRPTIYAQPSGQTTQSEADPTSPQITLRHETLTAIREGLWSVVNDPSGTAFSTARLQSLAIAGKTGTAENGTSADHGWFAGYAPAAEPRLAFVVVLEHAQDGTASAGSMARRMVEQLDTLGYFPQSPAEVARQTEFPPGKG